MSIIREHLPFYNQIFEFPEFMQEPFLMIGLPTMEGAHLPKDFDYKNLKQLLKDRGLKKIHSLDLFDPKAGLKLDLNQPIPEKFRYKYKVVADFGTIEHIFDTKQCLENYFNLLAPNGLFVLLTVVNGYFGHGFQVFNPKFFQQALKQNHFKILYQKYTSSTGIEVLDPSIRKNILVWLVAKKTKSLKKFVIPQQAGWDEMYDSSRGRKSKRKQSILGEVKFLLREGKRFLINRLPKKVRESIYGRI